MKRTNAIFSIFLVSVLLLSVAATFGQATPTPKVDSNQIINSGTGSMVYLNLPPSTVTSSLPWHPSDLQLRCYHFDTSPMGPYDAILVYIWIPQRNSYSPAAFVTDAPNIQIYKDVWFKTYIWYNITGNSEANMLNVIQVQPDQLQVILDQQSSGNGVKGGTNGNNGNLLLVNFTTTAAIKLPFNIWSAPSNSYGNLTFTLPQMTLFFRDIGDSYLDIGANATLPSGYYRQPISEMRTPAWVEERVPSWVGATSPPEVCGHIDYRYSEIITPPKPAA